MDKIKVTLSLDKPAFDALNCLASERTRGQFVSNLLRSALHPPTLNQAQQAAIGAIRGLLDLLENRTETPPDARPLPVIPAESGAKATGTQKSAIDTEMY